MTTTTGYRSYGGEVLVTGEGVTVELPVASVLSRIGARLIDVILTIALLIGVGWLASRLGQSMSEAVMRSLTIATVVGVLVVIPVLIEVLTRGRSPGKYALGLRTVRDDGGPITVRHSIIRQLTGFVEFNLMMGAPSIISAIIHPRAKRVGDLLAGTYVIGIRHKLRAPPTQPGAPALQGWIRSADIGAMPSALTLSARQYLARYSSLAPHSRDQLSAQLIASMLSYIAPAPPPGYSRDDLLRTILAESRRRGEILLAERASATSRVLRSDPLDATITRARHTQA